ncbi:MAG: ribosome maturation factor RimP [Gammaproteobacteria bacterium]|nr:MAG: ribosome maturation factor RimP [Gammaproteobacteria bacterium]
MGYEFVGVEQAGVGAGTILRVYIDSADGIMLNDCEKVSRQLSALLDVEDPISGRYTLEVSSPGLDRPLMKLEDFQRFEGEEARIKVGRAVLGRRNFTGRLRGIEGETVLLEMDQEIYDLPYADIERARLVPKL